MTKVNALFVPLVLSVVAFVSGPSRAADMGEAPVHAAGDKTFCIPLNRIDRTRIVDDRTILFEMKDGAVYRNDLANVCPGLKREDRFSYKTSSAQLCAQDLITVLPTMGISGPTCSLGEFMLTDMKAGKPQKKDAGK